jgi:hypothetical protein
VSEFLKKVNTCTSDCVETKHLGREHIHWIAEQNARARDVQERVEAFKAAAKELAAVMDPDAFEGHPIEQRQEAARLQWAARRFIATEQANRLLTSDRFGPVLLATLRETVEGVR